MRAAAPHRPWIVPVAGFLGAGKTTLIVTAARLLAARGIRSAAILNDQGSQLVDTAYVRNNGIDAGQVTGGCFCCRFSDLIEAAEQLRVLKPDVIFAEPVGSCIDLSATILQPLLREFHHCYRTAPLTVLVDPQQWQALLQPDRDPHLAFLFEHQIAEADLIAFSKTDLYTGFPELPGRQVRYLSAMRGEGISAWLDEVISGVLPAAATMLEVDYERYARAEAALGWLNWSASIHLHEPLSPSQVVGPLLDGLQLSLARSGATIAHLKILDETDQGYLKAAVTGEHQSPSIEGDLTASPVNGHELQVNLRALIEAPKLEQLFRHEINEIPGACRERVFQCFHPSPPKPERRYSL